MTEEFKSLSEERKNARKILARKGNDAISVMTFIKQIEIQDREFIKRDWQLTNHFLWDLLRRYTDDDIIEIEITNLYNKKKKLVGKDLI